jgi:hypothetical protein
MVNVKMQTRITFDVFFLYSTISEKTEKAQIKWANQGFSVKSRSSIHNKKLSGEGNALLLSLG